MLFTLDQAAGAAQSIMEPPSGGVSPLSWVIISGLAVAVVALGRFCLVLYNDLKKAREELASMYEEQAQLLKTLRVGLDFPKPHPPPPGGGNQGGTS